MKDWTALQIASQELYKLSIGPQRPRLSCCTVEKTRNLTSTCQAQTSQI